MCPLADRPLGRPRAHRAPIAVCPQDQDRLATSTAWDSARSPGMQPVRIGEQLFALPTAKAVQGRGFGYGPMPSPISNR